MRGENEPAIGGRSDTDGGSVEDARIEPLQPTQPDESDASRPTSGAPAPGWTKRLSARGKLARALVVALAMLVTLAVLLLRSAAPLPPQIAKLLTPAPTRTPTPGQFTTGAFEPVPPPDIPGANMARLMPSPRDPATAYVCPNQSAQDPTSGESPLWVTHTAGQTWSRVALPADRGTGCDVEPAWDGSHRVVISASTDAPNQAVLACASNRFYLSDDDGATWRAIALTSLAPPVSQNSDCFMSVTARHLFLDIVVNRNENQLQSMLERSDDDGQTWQRADQGLETLQPSQFQQTPWFALPLDGTGEALVMLVTNSTSGNVKQADFWVTHDAGAHWQRVPSEALPGPAFPIGSALLVMTEPALADASQACRCVILVNTFNRFNQRAYSTRDLTHWTPSPPLPVKGANAQVSGIYATLGMTGDGRLVVIGPDPDADLSALIGGIGPFTNTPPALWLWDTHTGRWEVARTQLPCTSALDCYRLSLSLIGVSIGAGAPGQPPGTWFWIRVEGPGRDFRLFIPAV
jgi:hypothetical protein